MRESFNIASSKIVTSEGMTCTNRTIMRMPRHIVYRNGRGRRRENESRRDRFP